MSLFLKDFNGVVRFFPNFFFHLVASFGHYGKAKQITPFGKTVKTGLETGVNWAFDHPTERLEKSD